MKIYIAGSITKELDNNENYEKSFNDIERALIAKGHAVLNPCKNLGFSRKDYIFMGIAELSRCDAIYMLSNWRDSEGAIIEHQIAKTTGMEIFYDEVVNDRCDLGIRT